MAKHPHSSFLDDLGGAPKVAELCGVPYKSAWNWYRYGVPRHMRHFLAMHALTVGAAVPSDFLTPAPTAKPPAIPDTPHS